MNLVATLLLLVSVVSNYFICVKADLARLEIFHFQLAGFSLGRKSEACNASVLKIWVVELAVELVI